MKSLKIGAVAAMLIASTAFGQSMMTYTVELGGNNQAADWNGPCTGLKFSGGSGADGQVFSVGAQITWAVKVAVSGVHSNGIAPAGAANMVASLELTKDGGATNVRGDNTGNGQWYSTINNGGTGCMGADPTELAAFPVAWTVAGQNGRVIDDPVNGGPLGGTTGTSTAYWQYPSAAGYPAASTAAAGTLVGMGAGYANFIPADWFSGGAGLGGNSTSGIGISTATACAVALGTGPVFEGQLDTTGMAAGTYVLKVVPGTGNNILNIPFDLDSEMCLWPDNTAFALKVDQSQGDTITFHLQGVVEPCVRTVVGRSVFYNGSFYGAAAATDKAALLPGQMASRGTVVNTNGQPNSSNVISYTRSLNGVYIDIARTGPCAPLAGAIDPSNFEFVRLGRALNGAPVAIAAPTSITAAPHPSLANTDRITITWANNAIPNTNWVKITAKASLGLAANDVHYWGIAIGDGMDNVGNNVLVDGNDQIGPRPPNNHTTFSRALITDVWDFDKNSLVDGNDQLVPRPPNNTTTFNCLVLGVAP